MLAAMIDAPADGLPVATIHPDVWRAARAVNARCEVRCPGPGSVTITVSGATAEDRKTLEAAGFRMARGGLWWCNDDAVILLSIR